MVLDHGFCDFGEIMKHQKDINSHKNLGFLDDMLQLVAYINGKSYVWKNVKPQNFVMLEYQPGNFQRIKAIDFDICC